MTAHLVLTADSIETAFNKALANDRA